MYYIYDDDIKKYDMYVYLLNVFVIYTYMSSEYVLNVKRLRAIQVK